MIELRKEIRELSDYKVPQNKDVIKLNQNESPFDPPLSIKEEIVFEFFKLNWAQYPKAEDKDILRLLSEYTGFPPEGILIGNGSNELIQAIFLAFLEKGKTLLTTEPGFAIYSRLAKIMQIKPVYSELDENFEYNSEDILHLIKELQPNLIILPSPHNPCGSELDNEYIREICSISEGLVVIDEAYYEFSEKTALNLIKKFKNLLILRTFSKAFGLAGLRIGYIMGNPFLIKIINKVKLPFSVNSFSQFAIKKILKNRSYINEVVSYIKTERDKLISELDRINGIKAYPSKANFVLFEIKNYSARKIFEKLMERKILIRYFDSQKLERCLRVTIGKKEENEIFLSKLKECLNESE